MEIPSIGSERPRENPELVADLGVRAVKIAAEHATVAGITRDPVLPDRAKSRMNSGCLPPSYMGGYDETQLICPTRVTPYPRRVVPEARGCSTSAKWKPTRNLRGVMVNFSRCTPEQISREPLNFVVDVVEGCAMRRARPEPTISQAKRRFMLYMCV